MIILEDARQAGLKCKNCSSVRCAKCAQMVSAEVVLVYDLDEKTFLSKLENLSVIPKVRDQMLKHKKFKDFSL